MRKVMKVVRRCVCDVAIFRVQAHFVGAGVMVHKYEDGSIVV